MMDVHTVFRLIADHLDVHTVFRLIADHRTVRRMNEVYGCGLYIGPSQRNRLNKTDYDRRKSPCGTEMQSDICCIANSTDTQYAIIRTT